MIETCIVIALAAGTTAVTLGKSKLFAWLREWPMPTPNSVDTSIGYRMGWKRTNRYWRLLATLLRCPFCICHWLVLTAAAVYQPQLVHSGAATLDVLVTALATVAAAAAVAAVLCRSFTFENDEEDEE